CCKENKVSDFCSSKMCAVETSPNAFATVSIATTCRVEWPKVRQSVYESDFRLVEPTDANIRLKSGKEEGALVAAVGKETNEIE
ncbi:hypothetical protein ANCDUO_21141, partial [Ancylostoma duodenale]